MLLVANNIPVICTLEHCNSKENAEIRSESLFGVSKNQFRKEVE